MTLIANALNWNADNDIAYSALSTTFSVNSGSSSVDNPTGFTATSVSTSQINLIWTENAAGDEVMVVYDEDNTFTDPVDGTPYSGSALGGTVIYQDATEAFSHSSLSANTTYYYKAWSVDGSDNYSSGVTANGTTLKDQPSNHITSFATSDVYYNQMSLTWADNDGGTPADKFLIAFSAANFAEGIDVKDDLLCKGPSLAAPEPITNIGLSVN